MTSPTPPGHSLTHASSVVYVVFDTGLARQRRRLLALRLARHAAQTESAALERLRDRAALMACHARDENRSIVRCVECCRNRAHGCTHEAKPRSRRSDSMTQKVVLAVKTSAAASTP